MSSSQIALLGAIAGFTIYLGLPLGRLRAPLPRLRALLNAVAIGILLFLLFDVLSHAWAPVDSALSDKPHRIGDAVGYGLLMAAGIGVAFLGLTRFDRWVAKHATRSPGTGPGAGRGAGTGPGAGPGAASAAELGSGSGSGHGTRRAPLSRLASLPMLIAIGIGLHNFAEGLAIGNSAAGGEISLAVMLIVGFGLHNATEGFGIVAPMAAVGERPSWRYLGLLGLIGGGPTFAGTLVGEQFTSTPTAIAFLSLAAGSILYVVIELLAVARRTGLKELTSYGIMIGLVAGFLTDAIVTLGGA
ncbi:ZIP family metal transporter [Catenulispora rubra]|uniref:ZIP family metal transporter n=1 Tax=Catenulispora rubra TaxID=280293 RepID=UPI0018924A2D|nr:ZIP family metal transporter [Catenulispora rubra]